LCTVPLAEPVTVALFVDRESPDRREYLEACCQLLALGRRPLHLPRWAWTAAMSAATVVFSLRRRRWENFVARFRHNLRIRRFDPAATERLLGFSLSRPWRKVLSAAFAGQEANYSLPRAVPRSVGPGTVADRILYVGCGRIVRDRHLPALQRLGYPGVVEWYDPYGAPPPPLPGLRLERVERLPDSRARIAVLATPPASRLAAIGALPPRLERLLCEKPFALTADAWGELEQALGGRQVHVIHNYRFKRNVAAWLAGMAARTSGRLKTVNLHFDSPAVELDGAAWLRDERQARTLLMDYGLHFVDLACLLSAGAMTVRHCAVSRDERGRTESIDAFLEFGNHSARLFLRQGVRQRRCQLEFVFQNCSHYLRFFPDSTHCVMGTRTPGDDLRALGADVAAAGRKLGAKATGRVEDRSHEAVLAAFTGLGDPDLLDPLRLDRIRGFYHHLFALSDLVYGPAPSRA